MKTLFTILIFCLVLFVYLHINFHLKQSNDLEVYEIDQPSKEKLEEICDIRQPVIFDYNVEHLINDCNLSNVENQYGAFDVKVRNVKDFDESHEIYLPVTFSTSKKIFTDDNEERFISENNSDFLEETGLVKTFRYNDIFLRPYFVSNCVYDYVYSSKGVKTQLRYNVNYRNFYLVNEGSVKIKLIPPVYSKYLYEEKDYDNFEFKSPVNPWDVQTQFRADFDKLKTLEVTLTKGQIICIPAYWWNSFQFEENTSLSVFKYRTYMNNIAISNHLVVSLLQSQNVKREIAKKKNLSLECNEVNTSEEDVTDE